jgi:TonB family protein
MNGESESESDRQKEQRKSLASYLLVAIIAGSAIWTIQQNWIQDSSFEGDGDTALTREDSRAPGAPNQPAKGDIRTLFSSNDYPESSQRAGEEGIVQAQLAIDKRGRVTNCTVIRSATKQLDRATCNLLKRRARFTPARDVNGTAVPDTVVTPPIVWKLEG